jgi:hypothetical protein
MNISARNWDSPLGIVNSSELRSVLFNIKTREKEPKYRKIIYKSCQVLVAHICNPSYLGGRNQEDHGSKPDRETVYETVS